MIIIGITGTLGAGKGTIVDYLLKEYGFTHFSVRGYLSSLLKEEGLEPNRDNLVMMGNKLRSLHAPSYIAEQLYHEAIKNGSDCIIESIRTVGEVNALRSLGKFFLLSVDADQKLRYERIVERASSTDKISFSEFADNEKREMESTDPNKQNLTACMKLADFVLKNNGSYSELYSQIENILDVIRK